MICGSSSGVLRQFGLFLGCVDLLHVCHLHGCETLSQIIVVNYKFTNCTICNKYLPLHTLPTVGYILNYTDRCCFYAVWRSECPLNLIYRTISVKEGRATENHRSQQMSSYIKPNALGFSTRGHSLSNDSRSSNVRSGPNTAGSARASLLWPT